MNTYKPIQDFLIVFMKIVLIQALILTVLAVGAIASDSKGQEILKSKISITAEGKEIKKILSEIEKKAKVRFTYSSALIDVNRQISIRYTDSKLSEILDGIFEPDVTYQVKGNQIILKPAHTSETDATQDNGTPSASYAIQVGGKITDNTGQPLPGANILEKGTTNGTTSDAEGVYSLTVANENSVLVISFIGFLSKEIPVGSQTTINITLEQDVKALEEVLVVGYGTITKSQLTGAISSVSSKEIAAYPTGSSVQALQGRVAGLQISSNNGEPGATYRLRIRGGTSITASSDPIFVVDGMVGGSLPPPESIDHIEVLKDASATAIYGSRGSNGVIIITTKKGRSGKPVINLSASYTAQKELGRYDLLNAQQFTEYIQELVPTYVPGGDDTDWQDLILQTGHIKNYDLSVSGGSPDVSYYVAGNYFGQEGIILKTDYARYSLTSNINIKASEKLNFGVNLFGQRTKSNGTRTQETSGGVNNTGVMSAAIKMGPDQPIWVSDGVYVDAQRGDPHDNPYAIAHELIDENTTDRLQLNLSGEYAIIKDLKFKATLGATTTNGRTGGYTPRALNAGSGAVNGIATISGTKSTLLLSENYFTYDKSIADAHKLNVVAGFSYQTFRDEDWNARSQTFLTDEDIYWNIDAGTNYSAGTGLSDWKIASYYGRLNYSFKDKYLLTFTARRDGASQFSTNHKWAFFPSGSIAWNVKEEAFMQDINKISALKIRISNGLVGNRAIEAYETLAVLGTMQVIQDDVQITGYTPTKAANPDLKWETSQQLNIGLDVGLFNDRVNLTVDAYKTHTRDLLFDAPIIYILGQTNANSLQNVGELENKGLEISLNVRNHFGQLRWTSDLNIAFNRNKVLKLPEGNDKLISAAPGHLVGIGESGILREGQPVGAFYGYIYEGVYQSDDVLVGGTGFDAYIGGEKYRDINGRDDNNDLTGVPDGQLNGDDRTVIGNPQPDFIWGFNNTLEFKGFDLNFFFQGSQGNDVMNFTFLEIDALRGFGNASKEALKRWTPTNTNTNVPMADLNRSNRISSRWVYDGSYIRLKNVALGYTLPKSLLSKIRINSFRMYVSAQNILTFTDYPGIDPEVNFRVTATPPVNIGLDYGSYPGTKSMTVGLNIGL